MRSFLKYIWLNYLSLISLLIVLVLISTTMQTKVDESKLECELSDELNAYAWLSKVQNANAYILGSSSLKFGLSSSMVSDSMLQFVNLSLEARDPVMFYLLLKKYSTIKKPSTILVGLDPWIFTRKYYRYRNAVMYLDLNGAELFRFYHNDHSVFSKRIEMMLGSCNLNDHDPDSKDSVIPFDYGSGQLNKAAVNFTELNDWFELDKTGWSELQFEYLKKLNAFCRQNKIRVVYLMPPKRKDQIEHSIKNFSNEHRIWWNKICDAIPNEEVLGSFDLMKQEQQDSVFAEAYHLNIKGQAIYSKYVRQNLNNTERIHKSFNIFQGK